MKRLRRSLSLLCLTLLIACQSPPNVTLPATLRPLTVAVTPANGAWQVWSSALSNVVYSLAARADRLWVGGAFGTWGIDLPTRHIVRYDDQLTRATLLLLLETGQVWVSDSLGLTFFDGQQRLPIAVPQAIVGERTQRVVTLAIDSTGDLWLETSGRWGSYTVIYHGHSPIDGNMQLIYSGHASAAIDPADCQKWSALVTTYYQYHSSAECRALQAANRAIPQLLYSGLRLAIDAEGGIWGVDYSENTLLRWSNSVAITINPPHSMRVTGIAPDPQRGMWVGTNWGLMYTDGTTWYTPADPDPNSIVGYPLDLAIEPSGQTWLLMTESKLGWLQSAPANTFKFIPGIGAHALAVASDGIWITQGADLIRLKLGDPIPASLFPPLPDCKLDLLTTDRIGDVWATTECGFAWQYQPATGHWVRHVLNTPAPNDMHSDVVQQIVAGTDGTLYAIGRSGLGQLTEVDSSITGTLETNEEQLPYITYRHRALLLTDGTALQPNGPVTVDRQGDVWLATNRGELWHYTSGHATVLGTPFGSTTITALQMDQYNRLWATGRDRQLAVYDGRNWRAIAMPDLGEVKRIVDAPDKRIWFVGNAGVAVYDPAQDKQP